MFLIGEYIIYGANGVCKVVDITDQPIKGTRETRKYYVLEPVYMKDSTIYTPVDNEKVVMRRILKEDEARHLIDKITEIPTIDIKEEKSRNQYYSDSIKTYDCENLVSVVKTVYQRKQARTSHGKKVLSMDDTYLKKAEDLLYGEMAIALSIPKDTVCRYIENAVNETSERAE